MAAHEAASAEEVVKLVVVAEKVGMPPAAGKTAVAMAMEVTDDGNGSGSGGDPVAATVVL